MQAHLAVLVGVHGAGHHDGDVLLRHNGIGNHAGDLGEGDQTGRTLDQLLELVDDDFQLVCILHDTAEHHGDDGHGNGGHHTHNTAGFQQASHGVAGVGTKGSLHHSQGLLSESESDLAIGKEGAQVAGGLENQTQDRAGQNT